MPYLYKYTRDADQGTAYSRILTFDMNDEDIRTEFPTEFWSTLSDIFCKSVTEKIEGGTPTFTLVALAEKNIACLKKAGAIKRDIYRLSTVHEDIRPEAVLGAMLAHATDNDTCTAPRRYVACSTVTAAAQDEQLIELANVWIRYLFWSCETQIFIDVNK